MNLEELKQQEPIFLPIAKDGGYVCPFCGNGSHGRKGTGIHRIPGNVRFHCFGCGYTGSVIDLYGQAFGIANDRQMIQQCRQFFEHEKGVQVMNSVPNSVPQKNKTLTDFTSYYDQLRKNRTSYNGKYLYKRGISKPLQDDVDILYDPQWRNPVVVQKAQGKGMDPSAVPTSPRVIIPFGMNGYFARDTRDECDLTETQKNYVKQNVGKVDVYSPRELNYDRPVFVTEGQIDCLSVIQACGQAVALCGAGNTNRFMEAYAEKLKESHLCLMLDMDEAGRQSQDKLSALLTEAGISWTALDYPYHDPNDFLVKDPGSFTRFVAECETKAINGS